MPDAKHIPGQQTEMAEQELLTGERHAALHEAFTRLPPRSPPTPTRPARPTTPGWAASKALFAASLADQDLIREYLSVALLLSPADEVFGRPGVAERVMRLGAHAPRYPLPGPELVELLAAISG